MSKYEFSPAVKKRLIEITEQLRQTSFQLHVAQRVRDSFIEGVAATFGLEVKDVVVKDDGFDLLPKPDPKTPDPKPAVPQNGAAP